MIAAGALIVIDTDTSPRSIPANSVLHVVERVDRHPLAADLAERARAVGVVAHQRGHVKRGREAGLAVLEQIVEALVGLLAGAESRELAHRPQAAAVHRLVHPARERVLRRAGRSGRARGRRCPRAGPPGCRARGPARPIACGPHGPRHALERIPSREWKIPPPHLGFEIGAPAGADGDRHVGAGVPAVDRPVLVRLLCAHEEGDADPRLHAERRARRHLSRAGRRVLHGARASTCT